MLFSKSLLAIFVIPSLLLCPRSSGQEPPAKPQEKAPQERQAGDKPQEKPAGEPEARTALDALLDREIRAPKKAETVLQYFRFLEETLWEKKVQLRLRVGSSGLEQYAVLMKQPASKMFATTPGDPFTVKSTLRNQLHRLAEPTAGRLEITAKTVTIFSMKEDSEDFHDK